MKIRATMECALSREAAELLGPDPAAALRASLGRAEAAVRERRAQAVATGEPRLTAAERENLLRDLGTEQAVIGALLRSLEVEVAP